ncbi:hypothetical protein R4Z10_01695 [Niallia sp. XMNu-256]|uniref:hypothetical protein n=1 Tax=Niallia sp. XMNu-256 TaxID=3082444 RepID=UPI0030CC0C60
MSGFVFTFPSGLTIWTRDDHSRLTFEHLEEMDKEHQKEILLGGNYGVPDEDLGPVMVFQVSDASKFITGQLLPVDGG